MVIYVWVHDLIRIFFQADKPVVAECYGGACLAFARDYWQRKSLIRGKHVTGHPHIIREIWDICLAQTVRKRWKTQM